MTITTHENGLVSRKLDNGNTIGYKIVNGTAYHAETLDAVVNVLEKFRGQHGRRIRVFYGNTTTGRDWLEEYDTMGYINRSTGSIKIPILVHNERSMGGGALMDHSIVRITVDGVDRYRHPLYHQGTLEIKPNPYPDKPEYIEAVYVNGDNHAAFKKPGQAQRWIEFIKGNKNRK